MSMPSRDGSSAARTYSRSGFAAFRFILLVGLLDAFGPLGIDMYLPAFPQIKESLQAPAGSMELTLAFFLAGLAVGQLICGPISDRIGRRIPLIVGSAAFAVASCICAFATSIESLIAARFLMGLAGSTGMVIARAVVRDSFDESESARVYSLLMLVIGIAPIISPSFGAWLMQFGDWTIIFYALGAFAAVCGIAVLVDLPETHPVELRSKLPIRLIAAQYAGLLVDFRFMGFAMAGCLGLGQIFAYVASAPALFMEQYGVSQSVFAILFAGNAIGLIGAAQLNRWLSRRFNTHQVLTGAMLANLAVSLLLPILSATGWGGLPVFTSGLFLCLATLGIILPNATAAAMAPFPGKAGVASALYGTLQFIVGSGCGALVGALANGTSLPMTGTIALCSVLALVTGIAVNRQRLRAADPQVSDQAWISPEPAPSVCLASDQCN